MRQRFTIVLLLAMVLLNGCANTAEGVKKDSAENSQKAAEQAKNLGAGVKEAGKDIGAATLLTPKIKLAIDADKRLNDPHNLIDVNSTDEKVTLAGHVTSMELKTLAGELATKVLEDEKAKQKLENNLEIKP